MNSWKKLHIEMKMEKSKKNRHKTWKITEELKLSKNAVRNEKNNLDCRIHREYKKYETEFYENSERTKKVMLEWKLANLHWKSFITLFLSICLIYWMNDVCINALLPFFRNKMFGHISWTSEVKMKRCDRKIWKKEK